MIMRDGTEVRYHHSNLGKFEGQSGMAEYVYNLSLDGTADEETGETEWELFAARFGKRLLFENDRGFVTLERFQTGDQAREAFRQIDRRYAKWCASDPYAEQIDPYQV